MLIGCEVRGAKTVEDRGKSRISTKNCKNPEMTVPISSYQLPNKTLDEAVRAIQSLVPAGVGACGAQEMIMIQLLRSGEYDEDSVLYKLVRDHYDLFVLKKCRIYWMPGT